MGRTNAKEKNKERKILKEEFHYNLMVLPGFLLQFLFAIVPMAGIVLAFQNYNPRKGFFGSEWVGLSHFEYMFQLPEIWQVFSNTLVLAVAKIIFRILIALIFALFLNEVRSSKFKSIVQPIVYVPHFISWVLLSVIFLDMFSVDGIVNTILTALGKEPIVFLTSNTWFPVILVITEVLKEFGYGAIIFLAALTGINQELYEVADLDGASRWQKLWNVTLPGISTTIILVLVLALGDIFNANFDQVFNMYNPLVYSSTDIIDTYVYRIGLVNIQYGLGTAVGLLKSVISFVLIILSYKLADKYANYKIF